MVFASYRNMIGRQREQQILQKALKTKQSEFIAVVGRRRVGKTYLIEQFYKNEIAFHTSGQKDFTNREHMRLFANKLKFYFPNIKLPNRNNSWLNIIDNLIFCLESTPTIDDAKRVIFFDELPWLCKGKSNFLAALGYFWNDWAKNKHIILVVCGSASSWMLSKIVKAKGSLYNRMTQLINVNPFTLEETQQYLVSNQVHLNTEQLINIYMALGGIPHYLKEIEPGISAVQNIQRICFSPNGLLVNEYGNLYDALFTNSDDHKKIVAALFKSKRGLTKQEIAVQTKLQDNGAFYSKINELVECGFVIEVQDLGKKAKNNLYRLIDEYSLFYHQFIKGNRNNSEDYWHSLANTAKYHSWSGYAFENICFRHINKIKDALQINGMATQVASFYTKAKEDLQGAQIDMVIDRADNCINIIECKYFKDDYYLSKTEADKIKNRKASFQYHTKTKKQLFITLISPGQLITSKESIGLVDNAINASVLI